MKLPTCMFYVLFGQESIIIIQDMNNHVLQLQYIKTNVTMLLQTWYAHLQYFYHFNILRSSWFYIVIVVNLLFRNFRKKLNEEPKFCTEIMLMVLRLQIKAV